MGFWTFLSFFFIQKFPPGTEIAIKGAKPLFCTVICDYGAYIIVLDEETGKVQSINREDVLARIT